MAIAEEFQVSVLVHGEQGDKIVSGTLKAASLEDSLKALGFLLGTTYRQEGTGVYLFGGEKVNTLVAIPSYGLTSSQLAGVVKDQGQVLADKLVLQADQVRNSEIMKALEPFGDRPAILLELLVLDLSDDATERFNHWLEDLKIGLGYFAKTFQEQAVNGAAFPGAVRVISGPLVDVRGQILLDWLESEKGARTRLREKVEILSGSFAQFSSGEVIERPIIIREPETGQDLVSRFDRRTIGLDLRVQATAWEGKWHLALEVQDSSLNGGAEKETSLSTERVLDQGDDSYRLLASFTREQSTRTEWEFPLLGRLPGVGKFLRREEVENQNRNVFILARQLPPEEVQEPEWKPLELSDK